MAETRRYGDLNLLTTKTGVVPRYLINGIPIVGGDPGREIQISSQDDFPVQDATTITLEQDRTYKFVQSDVAITKQFIREANSQLTSDNVLANSFTYTGSDPLFVSTGVGHNTFDISFTHPNSDCFSHTGEGLILFANCNIYQSGGIGTFSGTGFANINWDNTAFLNTTNGLTLSGSFFVVGFSRLFVGSSNASIVIMDLGSAVISDFEVERFDVQAPAGYTSISGLANSGNILTNSLATIQDSGFGDETTLNNITVDDIRYRFENNSMVRNTRAVCNMSMEVVSPETWTNPGVGVYDDHTTTSYVANTSRKWSISNTGVATYLGEIDQDVKISGFVTLTNSGGGQDQMAAKVALNWTGTGSGIPGSGGSTENNNPTSIPIETEITVSEGDDLRIIYANLSNGSNGEIYANTMIITEV